MIEITDEEASRAYKVYVNAEGPTSHDDMKKALADFLANRPAPVATLRPIAEMSEKPPEGCVRFTCDEYGDEGPDEYRSLFCDALLPTAPDPEADLRREFEEAMKAKHPNWNLKRDSEAVEYHCGFTESAWRGFKLAKGAKP